MPRPRPISGRFNAHSTEVRDFFAAVMGGETQKVSDTLKTHADAASWRDRAGNTPLMMAVMGGPKNQEVIDLLLEHGADVNAKNNHGGNALARAAHFGHKDIVRQLMKLGADPARKDAAGQDAVDWARMNGHKEIIDILRGKEPPPPPATPPVPPSS